MITSRLCFYKTGRASIYGDGMGAFERLKLKRRTARRKISHQFAGFKKNGRMKFTRKRI